MPRQPKPNVSSALFPEPHWERTIYERFGNDPNARPQAINDTLAAIAEARDIVKHDPVVNRNVKWRAGSGPGLRHPLGTAASPMVADPVTEELLAETLAPFTERGRTGMLPDLKKHELFRGEEVLCATADKDPSRVYLLTAEAVEATGGGPTMEVVTNADCSASTILLAAMSFMSVARNAWVQTKAPKSELPATENAFWLVAERMLKLTTAPPKAGSPLARAVVDKMVRLLRLRHPDTLDEDRLRIAGQLGKRVGLEKAGKGDLADRLRRRRSLPPKPAK